MPACFYACSRMPAGWGEGKTMGYFKSVDVVYSYSLWGATILPAPFCEKKELPFCLLLSVSDLSISRLCLPLG